MMKKYILSLLALLPLSALADTLSISQFRYSQPLPLCDFAAIGDTTGICDAADALALNVSDRSVPFSDMRPAISQRSLMLLSADFENRGFAETKVMVDSVSDYALYIDGQKVSPDSKIKFRPGTHQALLKFAASPDAALPEPVLTLITDSIPLCAVNDGKRMFSLSDVMYGTRVADVSLSPSGIYMLVTYRDTRDGGSAYYSQRLYDVKRGAFVASMPYGAQWLHRSDRYAVERRDYEHGRHLVAIDPASGSESILADHMPDGLFSISPTDDYLIFSLVREGAKEDPQIYRVIEPEDRQPGWRDRQYPAIYRFDNKVLQPLAIGKGDISVVDVSRDGNTLLLLTSARHITKRPTTLFSLLTLDVNTMAVDTIVAADGFISEAHFSPDASRVYVTGSPEAFGRVGCTLDSAVIPSGYDYQLFAIDTRSRAVTPLTRDFDPSVNSFTVASDGKIYLTATDRDMYRIYSIDPDNAKASLVDVPLNVVNGIDLSSDAPLMALYGQTDSAPDQVYLYNIKSAKVSLVDSPSSSRLADVRIGECHDWTFKNDAGETVYARYYLPDNFDPAKKYPLIVNYYGGCTPSTRLFESRYPMHVYSSLGYVCLVINPSGCSGFGQEWSSRHVSTAGQGVVDDIIAGTKAFCDEMDFVNPDKVGCIGASYGGFMTQYLQTVTDIFAAAVSHAGISDHTSYWGEGYWGYSYSEVSMGDDLPWTNPDLYVKQSPLYRAHKIHTPILLIHGDADTNVPVGESIQMFTALQRLGVDCALVEVAGQNHHISDDAKRKKWQETIFAWFAKYLQDDPSWWEALYPPLNL